MASLKVIGVAALVLSTFTAIACGRSTTRPSRNDLKALYWADLTSGDAARVAGAVAKIEQYAKKRLSRAGQAVGLLIQAHLFDQAETVATQVMLAGPTNTAAFAEMQKIRAVALEGQAKPQEALAAAKAYYDVALLRNTADAIDLICRELVDARPNDSGIDDRFKMQQEAWAATQPATEPSAGLGEPILAGIQVDGAPFQDAIKALHGDRYWVYVAQGNLLLVSGKASDARRAFEKAVKIAPPGQETNAVENVARAIRAEAGCVGPANAYLTKLQSQQ